MDFDSEKRLAALEQRIAELTSRIYHLEQFIAQTAPAKHPEERQTDNVAPATSPPPPSPWFPAQPAARTDKSPDPLAATVRPPSGPKPPESRIFGTTFAAQPSRSLESVVGGQWLNRLGIFAVLVGISYFLKLAFENDWIGPETRILIGLLGGIGLLLWSERFRRHAFTVFAYSLKAIGLGTLYLSLWASSQFYHLVPPWLTFAGMVAVTLTSATLALAQNSEVLAAGALVGAFLTPVLVSTKENQEVALLSYLLLLDAGAFWIVGMKRWTRLLPAAFVGTCLLSAGWANAYYNESELATTLVFATLFFLLFAMAPLVDRLDATSSERQRTMQGGLIIADAIAFLWILFRMLYGDHRDLLAWLLFAAAAFYFGLRRLLQHQNRSSVALNSLLLGLVVAFITVGIPVANEGRWITLGWATEAAIVLWIAQQTKMRLLLLGGGMVLALAVLQLISEGTSERTPLFNTRFGLYLLTIAVAALLAWVSLQLNGKESRTWAGGAVIVANVLALVAISLEIRDYFIQTLRSTAGLQPRVIDIEKAFSYSALWIIYGAALITVGFLKRKAFFRWQGIVLLGAAALKVFFFDIDNLDRGYRVAAFIALGIALLAVSFFYQRMRTGEARQ